MLHSVYSASRHRLQPPKWFIEAKPWKIKQDKKLEVSVSQYFQTHALIVEES